MLANLNGVLANANKERKFLNNNHHNSGCCCRDTLLSIAKHYETGESLPEDVYLKLLAAKTFRAGSFSLRQVRVVLSWIS